MKTAVVNLSGKHYNLGAAKLSNWLRSRGDSVAEFAGDPGLELYAGYDLVCLSAIFSWDVPQGAEIAHRMRGRAELWAGGPGFFKVQPFWFAYTGQQAHIGLDQRFEKQSGSYRMVFASRGCPVGCHFCIVPQLEGKQFTLDWDFMPAHILCDNNLSALPADFQDHIVRRYQETNTALLDANSGFEPHTFDGATYERWRTVLRGAWRFAFDIMPEWRDVQRVCGILRDVRPRMKRVYVLIGNEPIESCYERAVKTIEWGCEPHCQYVMPLDYLGGPLPVRFDWTEQLLKDFCRYFNTWGWRSYPLNQYKPRKTEPAPFAGRYAMGWFSQVPA